jgi:hypothetical protein
MQIDVTRDDIDAANLDITGQDPATLALVRLGFSDALVATDCVFLGRGEASFATPHAVRAMFTNYDQGGPILPFVFSLSSLVILREAEDLLSSRGRDTAPTTAPVTGINIDTCRP